MIVHVWVCMQTCAFIYELIVSLQVVLHGYGELSHLLSSSMQQVTPKS